MRPWQSSAYEWLRSPRSLRTFAVTGVPSEALLQDNRFLVGVKLRDLAFLQAEHAHLERRLHAVRQVHRA